MCAEGFYHTRSRKNYLLRLFIGFIGMNAANMALTFTLFNDNVMLVNNVFGTMLLTAIYFLFIDRLREGIQEKRAGKIAASVLLMLLPVVYSALFVFALNTLSRQSAIALSFVPNLMAIEGGPPAVVLGVLLYLCRGKRLAQTIIFSVCSILSFVMDSEPHSVQWLMIFALIPILLYNGRRGKGNKYFFYVFYPAHIYLFYIVAWFMR
jgi:heme/copper-type cytochrome/quinol oxidase subunit 2